MSERKEIQNTSSEEIKEATSVDEVLRKLRLTRQDLNTMSSTGLRSSISHLSVKEISMLCEVNRKFNKICDNESFWKKKVLDDYGINKKYGATWRETAKRFSITNMINLGTRWANGQTYKEVLDEYLDKGADELRAVQVEMLNRIFQDEDTAMFAAIELANDPQDQEIRNFGSEFLSREITDAEIDKIRLINSRDIMVIKSVILIIVHGAIPFLPGTANRDMEDRMNYNGEAQKHEFLRELIDPVPYVMQSSSFTDQDFDVIEESYMP